MRRDDHTAGNPSADLRADYAAASAAAGDFGAAADLMDQALAFAPAWTGGWTMLGTYRAFQGDVAGATEAFRAALRLDPADGHGAGLHLSRLGTQTPPAVAPPAFVRGLFDQYAGRFETSLVAKLGYHAPDLLLAQLQDVAGTKMRFGRVLDLGCGTGLMGAQLRPYAEHLAGLDLSPGMLAEARRKGVYDRLDEADILSPLPGEAPFDLMTAADVFIYIGDLAPVLANVSAQLVPGGRIAFTTETSDGPEPYRLAASLRYAHRPDHVERLLQEAGFRIEDARDAVLRMDRDLPVTGRFIVARR